MRLVRQPDGRWMDLDPVLPMWRNTPAVGHFERETAENAVRRLASEDIYYMVMAQWRRDYPLQRQELRKADGRRLPTLPGTTP